MKILSLTVLMLAFVCSAAVGQNITGSAHDFSGETWSNGEICLPCHTPHNGSAGAGPLWNHETTTTVFTLYTSTVSSTFNGTAAQPTGISKACLSCHDGTVALDDFGGITTGTNFISAAKNLGTDLSNDHPISLDYTTASAATDGGLFDPTITTSGITASGHIDDDMLFNDKIECSSCHDVHNAQGNPSLLLIDNDGSDLCLTCHNK